MTTNKFIFLHPTRCVISGPSASGKTEWIQRVIKHRHEMFLPIPLRIIYTYKYEQKWFEKFPFIEFTRELPKQLDANIPSMIVIDDIVCDNNIMKECASLFVRGSHHLNASIFFLTQNLFADSSHFRTISLNATQFVLFKTVRGIRQIEALARQMYNNEQAKEFISAYKDATQQPYSYFLVDLHPQQTYRLRTKIFPNEEEIVYTIE